MLDQTDYEILALLKENARLNWKEVGQHVHLSGQAVGNRVARLEKLGVIKKYTLELSTAHTQNPLRASIQVFMKSAQHHHDFVNFIHNTPAITRADRTSGESCYQLIAEIPNQDALNQLLNDLLDYGNYKLSLSIGVIKG